MVAFMPACYCGQGAVGTEAVSASHVFVTMLVLCASCIGGNPQMVAVVENLRRDAGAHLEVPLRRRFRPGLAGVLSHWEYRHSGEAEVIDAGSAMGEGPLLPLRFQEGTGKSESEAAHDLAI